MKKIFVFILFITAACITQAQMITAFPTEHDKFLKELDHYMTAGKNESNIKLIDEVQKQVKAGKLTDAWLDQVIATSNIMIARMMAPYPHFNNYLNAVLVMVKAGKTDAQFTDWNNIIGEVIKYQKKGENNDFLKFVDFSKGFFEEGALNVTPAKTWKVTTTDYKFSVDSGIPVVTFPTTELLGCIKTDTVTIHQTAGKYYPLTAKWEGKSGKVDWGRTGLDPAKVYCTFKDYSINLGNFYYNIDTVTFYHTEYFKQPLRGKLMDKMVASTDSINKTYPRFESYDVGMTIKDLAPNVSYTGGFSLNGSKVLGYGTADEKAKLTFYAKDGKTKVLSARSQTLSIKRGEQLGAEKAEVSIYFGTDSIYHPQLNLVYKVAKKEMRLLRGETGLGQAKFTDSYHNDEFQTDAIFWNLDSSVLNLKILSGVGKKPGVYESVNYFNKELLRKTQGVASYEPLSYLKKLYEKNGSREISALEFAKALDPNLKEQEVKSLLYDLVANGFIGYNEDAGVITIKEKAINYVLAKARKIDYDIINIHSVPQSGNDYIDLKSSNIDLKGVFEVPISDTAYVYFRPKNNSISLQRDRNMEFDGLVYAGRMDMTGQKFKFNYLPFTVDLNKVDSMRINIPDSNKVDKEGNPILRPMKSKVEGIKGLLEIDAPINKSGRTRLPQFPRLYSKEKSYIYYDDSTVAKGAYNRKEFFFELEPFRLDSLNNFSPDIINWKGKFQSGGIFPDITDSVHLQSDESLGFKSESPPGGFELYKGKGRYYGKYQLNYNGLQGDARVTHSTAEFTSHDIRLYPDSLLGTTDSIYIKKTFEGVKTPHVVGAMDKIFWKPNTDSMHISMTDTAHAFAMYDDSFTTFKGNLLLTDKDLRGNGTLDWDQATLSAKEFRFRTMDLSADTASLNIKTTGDRVSFKTPNVSAKVDFKTRIGDFKSNQQNIPTDFSYNQYTTAINEFKWFMDEKILDFKAPPQGQGEYFTSTRKEQLGLNFLGKRATYNLVTSVLRIEQVPEIKVADAAIVPDSGVVIIEGEAKMHQLRNAVVFADTNTHIHRFDSVVADIFSKQEFKGYGIYHYDTKDIKEIIHFGDISTRREKEGKHRNKEDMWRLVAKATIDDKDNFVLYPDVRFAGEGNIISTDSLINFKGFARMDFKNPRATTSPFFINQGVTPNELALKFDEKTRNQDVKLLSAGIHINPTPGSDSMYTTLLAPKQNVKDVTIFKSSGIVMQGKNGEYLLGDEKKIRDDEFRGNLLKYNDKTGIVKAEGKFDLGTNFGIIKSGAVGSAETKLDSGKYKLNLTLGLDAITNDKMEERIEFFMANDNADNPDVNYEKEQQKKAMYEVAGDDKKALEEFNKSGQFTRKPKGFDYNMIFTDVNFVFDPDDISLRSTGKIGVAMLGKKPINKKVDGYIEVQYKGGADVFTVYLETGTKGWFYFEYRPGTLAVLSSYDDVNKNLNAVSQDKRKVKGDKGRFYLYTPGSGLAKDDFVQYMKDREAGISRPHPEARALSEEIPLLGDTVGMDIPVNDTTPIDSAAMLRDLQQQQDIQNLKMGGGILSGPPPDRNKKTEEEPKPDVEEIKMDRKRQKEMDQLKQNNGGSLLSGPPADRIKKEEPKVDSTAVVPNGEAIPTNQEPPKQEVPVQQSPVNEPAKDTAAPAVPKSEVPVNEPPKQEVIPAPVPPASEPAKDTTSSTMPKSDAPVQTSPVSEPPKQDAPPIAEPPKTEAPKQEAPPVSEPPKTEPPKQDAPPVSEPPKQQAPVVEPPKQEAPPVSEPPKTEAPKQDAPPVSEPKQEAPVVEPPKQEAPPVSEPPKTDAPKQDAPPVSEPPKQEAPPVAEPPKAETPPVTEPPKQETPAVEPPKSEAPPVVEPPKQDAPAVTEPPKQEAPAVEPPKAEAPPVAEPPQTEAPKQEAPVIEPPKTEAPPVAEPVKTETPAQQPPVNEPPKQDAIPAQEPPKQTDATQQPPSPEPAKTDSLGGGQPH